MLNTSQIKPLKQVNISVDAEITKQRTEQVWKAAKSAEKDDVVALAGCAKATVYRVYQTGSISIKLAIAFGQAMNINPYYLTGETDKPGEFSEALLLQMLEQHGYKKLIAEYAPPEDDAAKPKRKYTRKPKVAAEEAVPAAEPEAAPEVTPEPEPEVVPEPEPEPVAVEESKALPEISEENLQALLHTMIIRSNLGVAEATDKLTRVTEILVY